MRVFSGRECVHTQEDLEAATDFVMAGYDAWRVERIAERERQFPGYFATADFDEGLDTNDFWRSRMEAPGTKLLGTGVDRAVLALCPKHVLKVDTYGLQNGTERALWSVASDAVRRRLAPVIADSGDPQCRWLLQARCVTGLDRVAPLPEARRRDLLEVCGGLVGDMVESNFGILGGVLVVCDYGYLTPGGLSLAARAMLPQVARLRSAGVSIAV